MAIPSPPSVGSQLVVPQSEWQNMIHRFHDSLFAGHLGVSRMVFFAFRPGCTGPDYDRMFERMWHLVRCASPGNPHAPEGAHGTCSDGPPLGESGDGFVGHVDYIREGESLCAGNGGLFLPVDGGCLLPDKTAISVVDAFFSNIMCRFGMPSVIHSHQGREFENKVKHELCLLGGSHKTKTTPYHPESDGLVERFNRTLLMMLAMFAGKHKDDWDDLLPPVMMAYRSSVHESTGFSPYRFVFGEECTLPMDIGLPRQDPDPQEGVTSPYAVWVKDSLEVAFDQVRQKRLYEQRAV